MRLWQFAGVAACTRRPGFKNEVAATPSVPFSTERRDRRVRINVSSGDSFVVAASRGCEVVMASPGEYS